MAHPGLPGPGRHHRHHQRPRRPHRVPGLRFPSGPGPSLTQIENCLAAVCAAADVAAAGIACAWLPDRVGDPATRQAISRLTAALGASLTWP